MAHGGENDLLQRYAIHGDQTALAEIVRQRIGAVYAVARRRVGDAHLAEDVTQAVFILLTRKARQIRGEAALSAWLFTVTRHAAANAMKMRARREFHERRALHERRAAIEALEETRENSIDSEDEELSPLLNEALSRLPTDDRSGVLMSCVDRLSYREVGAALGVSEEAARKRVARAVERMRQFFAARGVTSSAAAVTTFLAQCAAAVPPAHLIESTVNVASLVQNGGAGATLAKAVSQMIFATKLKLAAACVAVASVSFATAGVVQKMLMPAIVGPVQTVMHAEPLSADAATVKVTDRTTIRFAGVAKFSGGDWHSIDGKKLDGPPPGVGVDVPMDPEPTHQMVIVAECPPEASVRIKIRDAQPATILTNDSGPNRRTSAIAFTPKNPAPVDLDVEVADGPWERVGEMFEATPEHGAISETPAGGVAFTRIISEGPQTSVYVATEMVGPQWRVLCRNDRGEMVLPAEEENNPAGKLSVGRFTYNLPIEQATGFVLEKREYTHTAVAQNITLDPAKPSKPKISVEKKK